MVDGLLENVNEIKKLVSLNNYVDKVEVKPRKKFIPTHDLRLFQVLNYINMKDYLLKVKFIPTLLFLISFFPTTLPNSLYFTFSASNISNSAIELSLNTSKLVPIPPALAQAFKS